MGRSTRACSARGAWRSERHLPVWRSQRPYSPPSCFLSAARTGVNGAYRRNGFFTGRERLLSALHERFATEWAAVLA